MNQHTSGKEFCGEGKKKGGTAGWKLGEKQFVFQNEKVNIKLYISGNRLVKRQKIDDVGGRRLTKQYS